jgi:serine/threonine protein phosphatase PrpC
MGAPPTFTRPFDATYPLYQLEINYEARPGLGEDAPALWEFEPSLNSGLIGALDGLGGAGGGEPIKLKSGEEHTGAWVASRLVSDVASQDVYARLISSMRRARSDRDPARYHMALALPESRPPFDFTAELRHAVQDELGKWAAHLHTGGGRLKSRMIKTMPTTLAVCWYDLTESEFTAVWAGDSRIYFLGPHAGLQQVTTDDLKSNADALENLTDDSPMSNYVNADTDFVLHERRVALQPFSMLIAATDGCFGYLPTPLHFEHMLLSTMRQATDWQDWLTSLRAAIIRTTSDDSTLSAVAIGWQDFASCRKQFTDRLGWCEQRVKAYDDKHANVKRLEGELKRAREELSTTIRDVWAEYRRSYESLGQVPTRDVPDGRAADAAARSESAADHHQGESHHGEGQRGDGGHADAGETR